MEDFDLGHEAQLRLDREVPAAARRDVQLRLTRRGDLAFRGDREAILLALRNLVGNAVAWSPPGEVIEVTIEGHDDCVEVTVDDAGPGVPAAERDRIFQPFHRGRASPGARSGYGLGLSLTRTAVEAHGGSVVVDESPSGGARFRLRLPRTRAASASAPAPITGT
jgi:signal transduction histidine kinase